ncbi:MAG: DEAD/DEAH box helicase, partial [Candidatus Limnocylindrales bacterium]
MTALEALERFLGEPGVSQALAVRRVLPAQAPTFAAVPEWLDQRLLGALTRRGISALYSHQREALEALHDGLDIAIVTPTASGKSLCYNLPVLQEISLDPAARALYLFPTKALGQLVLAEGLGGKEVQGAGGRVGADLLQHRQVVAEGLARCGGRDDGDVQPSAKRLERLALMAVERADATLRQGPDQAL